MTITVHGVPGSPYVRAALMAFEEKGAPWRLKALGPGDTKAPPYLALMPFGRMPVIEHDGFTLYETQAILRWADQVFTGGPSLIPTDPVIQARMNQAMGMTDWYCFRSWASPIGFERVIKPMLLGLPTDEAAILPALPLAKTTTESFDALLAGKPYLVGDSLTLADLMFAPQLEYFAMTPEGREMLAGTGLPAYLARMQARPSWAATETETLRAAA